jgi:hypothetical protein
VTDKIIDSRCKYRVFQTIPEASVHLTDMYRRELHLPINERFAARKSASTQQMLAPAVDVCQIGSAHADHLKKSQTTSFGNAKGSEEKGRTLPKDC